LEESERVITNFCRALSDGEMTDSPLTGSSLGGYSVAVATQCFKNLLALSQTVFLIQKRTQ